MPPLRRLLAVLGLILLLASLVLLAASFWPPERNADNQPLSPNDLALPTSYLAPTIFFLAVVGSNRRGGRRSGCWIAGCVVSLFAVLFLATLAFFSLFTLRSASAPGPFPTDPSSPPVSIGPEPTDDGSGGGGVETPEALPPPPITVTEPAPRSPESRAVELDYPLTLRIGDSDVIRLALVIAPDGSYLTPTAESGGHTATGEPVKIPNLYDTHTLTAIARLDSVGLNIDRIGDWEQPLLPGENVAWRWTISVNEPGRQKANLIIHLRFIPKAGGDTLQKELWARTLTIQATDVFGLPAIAAKGIGIFGTILGSILSFPFAEKFYGWVWSKVRHKPAQARP